MAFLVLQAEDIIIKMSRNNFIKTTVFFFNLICILNKVLKKMNSYKNKGIRKLNLTQIPIFEAWLNKN